MCGGIYSNRLDFIKIIMNKFISIVLIGLAALGASSELFAQSSGDYPDLYLKGGLNGWSTQDNHKFLREANHYSITLPELDGEFKISDANWQVEFGVRDGGVYTITSSCAVEARKGGPNFRMENKKNVTISFDLNPDNKEYTTINFKLGGQDIPDPVDPDDPSVEYLSGTLPVLYINVYDEGGNLNNEVISKDLSHKNYFKGEYWLDLNGCDWIAEGAKSIGSKESPLPLEMKARGNWTRRGFSKKPFKLKLGAKQSMLGMTKSKHYAILAHADDNFGYMRNFTGFNLGKRIGLPWTPSQQPVEVVINGNYRGLYFLTESIRVGDDRVMIEELDDNETDPVLASGGYLVELDNYDEPYENQITMEEKGQAHVTYRDKLRVTFDTPELYSDLQRRFIWDQFSAINDAIGENSDRMWEYLDLDDAARYYIVEEIISHTEAYHGSTYLFRDRGEGKKWHFSPLWDCGHAFDGPSNNFFTEGETYGNTWIASLRLNDKFLNKVKETWRWFMANQYNGIEEDLNNYANSLRAAAESDYKRWNGQPRPNESGSQDVVDNRDIEGRLNDVKTKLRDKITWLRNTWGDYNGDFPEPAKDDTQAAALPDYIEVAPPVEDPIEEDPILKAISGTLPVLYINVYGEDGELNDEINSKDLDHKNYFKGHYWLDLNGCEWLAAEGAESIGSKEEPLPLEVKARGNWTRKGFAKKPFKLKLGAKQSMLGMTKSKHYAILAHADDNYGYMRNFTGFNLGKRIGLPWTPSQQPVEVVINGDYRGLYFLTESIRVGDNRVMIEELGDDVSDPLLASGGYLVELDNYDEPDESQIRMEEKGQANSPRRDVLRITFNTPEIYSELQRRFVKDQFTAINDAIGDNSDRIWEYLDLDDAARYYIVEEIISHSEAYHGSTYLFRDRGDSQKWHFSPLWDCGNAFNGPTDRYFTDCDNWGNTWIASLRLNNKFMDKVRETWKWFMSSNYAGIDDDLKKYAESLKAAADADYKRWSGQPRPDYDGSQEVVDNRNMDGRLNEVQWRLNAKIDWLRGEWGDYNGYFNEPVKDDTKAAPLPDYLESNEPVDPVDPPVEEDPVVKMLSGTLPVLYINVYGEDGQLDDEINSKDLDHKNYFKGDYWLDLNGCEWMEAEGAESIGSKENPLPLEIKARGNWTRIGFAKKPFKLKLGKKQKMLGLSNSKHFAILAHADDNFGYMRNFTGFNLGQRIGLPWTPSQQPVEVVINGDYRGLYFLTESIRVEDGRIEIQELDDNCSDPELASGGYLVELDNYDEENQIRMEEKGQGYMPRRDMLRITFDTPEVYSDLQRRFVEDQFTAINDAIGDNSDRMWSYLDLDDAARYYIVEEILSHTESYHGSTYLFRDRGEGKKWHFSPLWDCGNAFNGPESGYFTDWSPFGNTWIASLRLNGMFMDKVRETWKWFMSNKYEGIEADLDTYANSLKAAAEADFNRWNGQPRPEMPESRDVVDNRNMEGRLNEVKWKLRNKVNWLRGVWGDHTLDIFAEPEKDSTEAAPLPEYMVSLPSEVTEIMIENDGSEFYNLQGMKVEHPVAGEIYIVVTKEGKGKKVLIK